MAWALARSYSRAAWLGVAAALLYLLYFWVSRNGAAKLLRNTVLVGCIPCLLLVLLAPQLQNVLPARRVLLIGHGLDFSALNRFVVWPGGMALIADNPLGIGWDRVESFYNAFYRPPSLEIGSAVLTNDFLVFAASIGILPAIALAVYVLLGFTPFHLPRPQPREDEAGETLIRATFRGACIVLLVTFWFDANFFEFTPGILFWILLENGRIRPPSLLSLSKRNCSTQGILFG
jgi:hypothetical protein